ncbi:M14 family zinc carboxypeptidase [Erythrobacter sp. NE805]|uniref:M14 family zinc carboxypeptidase n=1 Tax=Erythrobacter sp. NE805 TaxID=3389875 RepID=UPI00396AFA67
MLNAFRGAGLLLAAALAPLVAAPAAAQSFAQGQFDPAIPTLTQSAGHAPGTRITPPDQAVAYIKALAAAAPDRTRLVQYATSWEGRPLTYLVISAPPNIANLDAIKADLAAIAAGKPGNGTALPVTWLAYGVHGNEISSTDAALMTAYHLLAAKDDARAAKILANTILVIDPMQNPDGRARFVNNFLASTGIAADADRQAAEHDEPWPSGRVNHYMFDLNRDWFTLSQPETRGKVAAIRAWNPVVVVDLHEMGGDETYFFSPAAQPFSPNLTPAQIRAYELIGRYNAAAFDARGEPYFTREVYDLFYPGYGDTWNAHQGAIGSTYEQGSARGLVFERRDGTTLTYADGVMNHFTASLATAEAVADNPAKFLADFAAYRAANATGAAGKGSYVIDLAKKRWNAERLGRRLAAQGITVLRREGAASLCGRSYPAGYLAVPQAQPAARLVRSLLDKDTPLPPDFLAEQERRRAVDLPHELYDVTAWSVGPMAGVDVSLCNAAAPGEAMSADTPIAAKASGTGSFAIAVPWSDGGQARLVTLALREGIEGRVTDKAFVTAGRSFPRGTVVFPAGSNTPEKMARLAAIADEVGAETVALVNGWVDSGPNLGSEHFTRLTLPRVAVAWDDGVSQLSAGALRYVLEQRIGLPVTPIRTARLARADLADYDVVLVPEGNPAGVLGEGGQRALRAFVQRGGVLVAIGESLEAFTGGDNPLLAVKREAALGRDPEAKKDGKGDLAEGQAIATDAEYREAIKDQAALPDTMPGALLNVVGEPDHFLSAGYDEGGVVLATGTQIWTPLDRAKGVNALRFAAPGNLIASGYVWDENRKQLAYKPYVMAQRTGRGLTIGFAHDPSTRGYLEGLDLMIANAVLVAPSRVR